MTDRRIEPRRINIAKICRRNANNSRQGAEGSEPLSEPRKHSSDPRVIIFCFIGRANTRRNVAVKKKKKETATSFFTRLIDEER